MSFEWINLAEEEEEEEFQRAVQESLRYHAMEEDTFLAETLQAQYLAMEQQEREDFALAQRIALGSLGVPDLPQDSGGAGPSGVDWKAQNTELDFDSADSAPYGREASMLVYVGASTYSPAHSQKASASSSPSSSCEACLSKRPLLFHLGCNHVFCKECLGRLFRDACADRHKLPVRCCNVAVNHNMAEALLTQAQAIVFRDMLHEHDCVNKMYCVNQRCSKFVDLDSVAGPSGGAAAFGCSKCGTKMCASCRSAWHLGLTCAQYQQLPEALRSPGDVAAITMAARKGWRACSSCHQMVEKKDGCNHITCSDGGRAWTASARARIEDPTEVGGSRVQGKGGTHGCWESSKGAVLPTVGC